MAINEISYANKSDINTSTTPVQNKISASDMNEIKSIVNANANLQGDLANLNTTEKGSLVGAINEVRGDTKWSYLDSAIGTGTITLPASFEELYVVVYGNNQPLGAISVIIPYDVLSNTQKGFNAGYNNGTSIWGVRILATKTEASLGFCWYGSTNYTNTSQVEIYYR